MIVIFTRVHNAVIVSPISGQALLQVNISFETKLWYSEACCLSKSSVMHSAKKSSAVGFASVSSGLNLVEKLSTIADI